MPRLRVWGLSVALVVGVGSSATAQPVQQTTLVSKLSGMFGPKKPKPVGPAIPTTIMAPLTPEAKLDALDAEKGALLRRLSVCTELRRVALERGDEALARQADELERQAASLYNARVAGLGVARVKAPLPEPVASRSALDSFVPPINQTATAKAERLTAPAAPIPASTTAQVREVNP